MYKESVLDNGLKILTYENASIPIIDMSLVFRAGSRYEGEHQKGYAHILEHMLLKGTPKRPSPVLIAKEIDDKGGYKNARTGSEIMSLDLRAADNYSEELFDLLSDMILNSLLDPLILENEKKIIIEELQRSNDNIESFFSRTTLLELFRGHPLATNVLGDQDSILSATSEELRKYKNTFLVPGNAALIIAGNISHDSAAALARKYLGEWPDHQIETPQIEFKPNLQRKYFYLKDSKQTLVCYNFFTVPEDKTRERLALELVRVFLNFGGSSILKEELRHKRGLVYSTQVQNISFRDAGLFRIRTSTTKPVETIKAIEDVIGKLKTLFKVDLLEAVKARLVGSFKLNIADPYYQNYFLSNISFRLDRLVTPEEYLSEISSITPEEILSVIETYLTPQKAVITAMGPRDFDLNI